MSIQFNVDQALAQVGTLLKQHGPEAIQAAEAVVQVNAFNTLSGIPAWGLLALGAFMLCKFFLRKLNEPRSDYSSGDIGWPICFGISGIAFGIFAVSAVVALFDVWAWVALFNPRLALAHELLMKVGLR